MKQSINIVKYVIVVGFCVVCAAGNAWHFLEKAPDANENIVFFNLEKDDVSGSEVKEALPGDSSDQSIDNEPQNESSKLININTASVEQLCQLNGIGAKKAKAIVEYRKAFGGFVALEEIMEVKGIGQATYEKIKDYITIE